MVTGESRNYQSLTLAAFFKHMMLASAGLFQTEGAAHAATLPQRTGGVLVLTHHCFAAARGRRYLAS
eukprot:6177195-Pleurochrysis_carterae.AAC.4